MLKSLLFTVGFLRLGIKINLYFLMSLIVLFVKLKNINLIFGPIIV